MSGLYLHIPFCRRKCPYCDFYSVQESDEALAGYPDLLIGQLQYEEGWGPFDSVFFGGGTPSLLAPADVGRILAAADRRFGLEAGAEVSLEANPGTLSLQSLAGYRAAGVNRLSLGVQSLSGRHLQRLGRIHSPGEARRAVSLARSAGFDNLSCDLMFALPGQSAADLLRDLEEVLAWAPEHLSCYGLSMEEGTPFHHQHRAGGLDLPDEERYAELFCALHERLAGAGYGHYEISNYALPGRECRHNLRYWQRLPYFGLGAGAHSFAGRGWGERRAVPPDLGAYAAALKRGEDPAQTLERFDRRGAMAETLYLGLRTASGVAEASFRARFGLGVAEAFPAAAEHLGGRLRLEGGHWRMDLQGWLLYDHLISAFL
ncbi:radical SAM family heme chaperone HemW [uncultured Desulfuromonas sp.]|uniref:radical SAM family heme chaperone HemW n=1 Tax=uncultured Desulfuromonas sp. TaxID=181013 RepID=UPI002607D0D4|nr:radical SAM family heme chaperone HemW [uncultured Desulfuromonas sp.]